MPSVGRDAFVFVWVKPLSAGPMGGAGPPAGGASGMVLG